LPLASGPLGYRPLREFLARKLERTAGIRCDADEILTTSGSLQALDLVNGILLARGDSVIIEQATYQGALTRLQRLGVEPVGIPLDGEGMRMDALAAALDALKRRGVQAKYIYTIPRYKIPPARSSPKRGATRCCALRRSMACRSSRTTAIPI
jgi:2-aminoadipate transaminase